MKNNAKNTVGDCLEEILKKEGQYIRFEGQGIVDGLKTQALKNSFYKIIGFEQGTNISCGGLKLLGYRSRNYSLLPIHCFKQSFEVITQKEYKTLKGI